MNLDTCASLLTRISYVDNREVTEEAIASWQSIIGDVPYDLAIEAMELHFRESPGVYIMPGHVLEGARRLHRERKRQTAQAVQTKRSSEEIRAAALQRSALDREERIERQEVAAEDYGKRALRHIRGAIANIARVHERIPHGEGVRVAEAAWQEFRAFNGPPPAVSPRSNPCGNALCHCSHTEGCEAGWISVDPGDFASGVVPCPQCKPKASAIIDAASTTRDRRGAMQLLREQKKAETTTGKGDEW